MASSEDVKQGCVVSYLSLNKEVCGSDFDTDLSGSTNCSLFLW